LASCNIEKEEEVSLMMYCHMNKKNEKGEFETKWELINKVKKHLKKKVKRVAEKREAISRLLKDEVDCFKIYKKK